MFNPLIAVIKLRLSQQESSLKPPLEYFAVIRENTVVPESYFHYEETLIHVLTFWPTYFFGRKNAFNRFPTRYFLSFSDFSKTKLIAMFLSLINLCKRLRRRLRAQLERAELNKPQ